MNKLILCVLFACTFLCVAQASPLESSLARERRSLPPRVVPMIANVCRAGCQTTCTAATSLCGDLTDDIPACQKITPVCLRICRRSCRCVAKCGRDCYRYERNCQRIPGFHHLIPMYCPITGGICDVGCLARCPQQTFVDVFSLLTGRSGVAVQNFMQSVIEEIFDEDDD